MKVLALTIFIISSSAALRSGPYLPSGWKPQGPAFLLPGEVEKSNTQDSKSEQESEPSGSDFLREYGPPKTQDLTQQYLPEAVTEQAFLVIRGGLENVVVVEANADLKSTVQESVTTLQTELEITTQEDTNAELTATESSNDVTALDHDVTEEMVRENPTTESLKAVEEKSEQIVESSTTLVEQEVATEKVLEAIVEEKQRSDEVAIENVSSGVVALAEQKLEGEGQVEVNNIADAIANLENEIKAVQVESQQINAANLEENSGALQETPEGFLEYGPPGFREYGPPKEIIVEENNIENNEARKRRFSPKFKSTNAY